MPEEESSMAQGVGQEEGGQEVAEEVSELRRWRREKRRTKWRGWRSTGRIRRNGRKRRRGGGT